MWLTLLGGSNNRVGNTPRDPVPLAVVETPRRLPLCFVLHSSLHCIIFEPWYNTHERALELPAHSLLVSVNTHRAKARLSRARKSPTQPPLPPPPVKELGVRFNPHVELKHMHSGSHRSYFIATRQPPGLFGPAQSFYSRSAINPLRVKVGVRTTVINYQSKELQYDLFIVLDTVLLYPATALRYGDLHYSIPPSFHQCSTIPLHKKTKPFFVFRQERPSLYNARLPV